MTKLDLFTMADADKEVEKFAIEAGWKPTHPNELFLNQYKDTMKLENPNRPTKPGFIRPSSLTSCVRKLTFEYLAEDEEFGYDGTPRIAESGTDAHKRIQNYIINMKEHGYDVEFIDVKDYLKANPNPDLEVIDETKDHQIINVDVALDLIVYHNGNKEISSSLSEYLDRYKGPETLVYNKKTHSRFKTDGIVKFNGKLYILEIKTENSKKYASHSKTLEPHDKHKLQGTFYGISFNISSVMFLYENRDTCATFVTVFEIEENIKNKVLKLINQTLYYGENNWVAPRTVDKDECRYCPYQTKCNAIGETLPK